MSIHYVPRNDLRFIKFNVHCLLKCCWAWRGVLSCLASPNFALVLQAVPACKHCRTPCKHLMCTIYSPERFILPFPLSSAAPSQKPLSLVDSHLSLGGWSSKNSSRALLSSSEQNGLCHFSDSTAGGSGCVDASHWSKVSFLGSWRLCCTGTSLNAILFRSLVIKENR